MGELLSLALFIFLVYIIIETRKIGARKKAEQPVSAMRKIRGHKSRVQKSISPKIRAYKKQKYKQLKKERKKEVEND